MKISYAAEGDCYLIIGGMSTIGQALTRLLLQSQATVYATDIAPQGKGGLPETYHYMQSQPTDFASMQRLLSELPASLTGLVCLSGTISHFGSVSEMSIEHWKEVFDISFASCYHACKLFSPLLMAAHRAAIVNMSSGLAFGGQANYGPYTNAKAAINSLSRTLATELAPTIRVNTVAPGAVDTAFIYDDEGQTRFDVNRYNSIVPLGEMAKPEEIAELICYLLSDGASHITGQCIHINGGAMMM